jgi:hypothetical protein
LLFSSSFSVHRSSFPFFPLCDSVRGTQGSSSQALNRKARLKPKGGIGYEKLDSHNDECCVARPVGVLRDFGDGARPCASCAQHVQGASE